MHEKNDDIAEAFDDHRRFTAVHRLAAMLSLGLLTDEEFAQLTEETQQQVRGRAALRDERSRLCLQTACGVRASVHKRHSF